MYRMSQVVEWEMKVGVARGCIGSQQLWWACVHVVEAEVVTLVVSGAVVASTHNRQFDELWK